MSPLDRLLAPLLDLVLFKPIASFVWWFSEHANRLTKKYHIPSDRVAELRTMEEQIRAWNAARRERRV